MAKMFVPESDKWGVKISIDKRRTTRSAACQRRVVLYNQRSSNLNDRNEKWHEDLKKFIADAKKDIDLQAKILIESAKKWQQNANEKFDLIQLHINREHNLQNSSATASNEERPIQRPTERRIGRPPKPSTERSSKKPSSQPKKVCFPSMPVLITDTVDAVDDLSQFLADPPAQLPKLTKKIVKRRSTVCVSEPKRAARDVTAPVEKASRVERSPVSAEPDNQPKLTKRVEEQAPIVALTPIDDDAAKNVTDSIESRHSIHEEQPMTSAQKKDDVFKKFLETREIVLARQKKREQEEAARLGGQTKDD